MALKDLSGYMASRTRVMGQAMAIRNMEHKEGMLGKLQEIREAQVDMSKGIQRTREAIVRINAGIPKMERLLEKIRARRKVVDENVQHRLPQFFKEHPYLAVKGAAGGSAQLKEPSKRNGTAADGNGGDKPRSAPPPIIPKIQYLTSSEFEHIPSYMVGRMKFTEINLAVEQFNTALRIKYEVLTRPLASLTKQETDRRKAYKRLEAKELKGTSFLTPEDLKGHSFFKLPKQGQNIITILRHCKRVKDVRIPTVGVRHVVIIP